MVEPYQWLIAHAQTLGVDPALCGPASVDLRLSGHIRTAEHMGTMGRYPCWSERHTDATVLFIPECFYLCTTQETVHIPETHCALLSMRSTWARHGIGHKMAGFIDPGFHGQLTLEIDVSVPVSVPIYAPFVQLAFVRLTEPTVYVYHGQYQNQTGPTMGR